MRKIDLLLHKVLDKYLFYIGISMLLIVTLIIRWHFTKITMLSPDYNNFILEWYNCYKELGIAEGLKQSAFSDYYIPYNLLLALGTLMPIKPNVLVSLYSCMADYISAFFIYKVVILIMKEQNNVIKEKAILMGIIVVLQPIATLNSALWKQCDSISACFIIVSLFYMLKNKSMASFIWLSVAFVFKMQAIFILPGYIILYIFKKNHSIFHYALLPIMYLLCGLPAIFCGRRWTNVYGIYFKQSDKYNGMSINFPNIYELGLSDYPALKIPAILMTMSIFICFALYLYKNLKKVNNLITIYILLWVFWTCTMFLPSMHERYNYFMLLLLPIFYFITDFKKSWIPILLNVIFLQLYGNYLFKAEIMNMRVLAATHIFAYVYVTFDILFKIKYEYTELNYNNMEV